MLRYLKLLILLPVAAVIIGLAVINRAPVSLTYWPQSFGQVQSIQLPLFVAMISALIMGVILGGMATWLAQGQHRRAERQYRREAERLRAEAERLKAMQPSIEPMLPVLKGR
jgi:uncharacterized integral membrane protein